MNQMKQYAPNLQKIWNSATECSIGPDYKLSLSHGHLIFERVGSATYPYGRLYLTHLLKLALFKNTFFNLNSIEEVLEKNRKSICRL